MFFLLNPLFDFFGPPTSKGLYVKREVQRLLEGNVVYEMLKVVETDTSIFKGRGCSYPILAWLPPCHVSNCFICTNFEQCFYFIWSTQWAHRKSHHFCMYHVSLYLFSVSIHSWTLFPPLDKHAAGTILLLSLLWCLLAKHVDLISFNSNSK